MSQEQLGQMRDDEAGVKRRAWYLVLALIIGAIIWFQMPGNAEKLGYWLAEAESGSVEAGQN